LSTFILVIIIIYCLSMLGAENYAGLLETKQNKPEVMRGTDELFL
jgi:hypothetical protein